MTRDEALTLVREFVKNEGLVRHMLSVEAAMRFYAEKFGEDTEKWGLVGLLHDFDWEIHPTLDQHPQDGTPILRTRRSRGDHPGYFEPCRSSEYAARYISTQSHLCMR